MGKYNYGVKNPGLLCHHILLIIIERSSSLHTFYVIQTGYWNEPYIHVYGKMGPVKHVFLF
jgi:hypothetical protein